MTKRFELTKCRWLSVPLGLVCMMATLAVQPARGERPSGAPVFMAGAATSNITPP